MMTILSINFMHYFFLKNHEDVSSVSEYDSVEQTVRCHKIMVLALLLNKSKIFE